ncbi:hypothetical protein CCMSSC00406_0009552 [Pleurotus cornucopiae]|uniref:Uncharacterized protein n=1 Tax=Pleurotus cornucopiae TaxID=5321 RepID=A0ACB7IRG9_PLECO|nr:hypothetical protein CCMSSC00406_0009552 [Pleurotus cornucopiae]
MSRTISYVASVFSTPSVRRKLASFTDTESPSKRRRLMSNDTEVLERRTYQYTPEPASPSYSQVTSISRRVSPVSPSNEMDTEGNNERRSISSNQYQIYPVNLIPELSPLPLNRLSSRRSSITSASSISSSSSGESIHLRLSSPNQRKDLNIAESHLRSLGFFVHKPTNILVCVQCSSGVPAGNAFAHITNASSKCRSSAWRTLSISYVEDCLRTCGALNPVKFPSLEVSIPPIPTIPVLDGWICKVDPNMACYQQPFASSRTRQRHFQDNHPDIVARTEYYVDTKLQNIYNYRGYQRCIRVHLLPPQVEPPRYDAFISSCPDGDPLPDSKAASLVTQPTVFESITRWATALVGVDIRHLKTYSRPPYTDTPEYDSLTELVVEFITTTVADKVKSGGHRQLLQQVHSTEPTKLHKSPLRYPKKRETLDSYARIFSCYLTMMVRSVRQPIPGYPIHMTAEQTTLSLKLFSNLDDPDISAADLHLQVHELCWALLSCHPIESTQDELNTPILRFLIAHNLVEDGDGNFKKSKVLSHTLSAIQWCWQAIGYSECIRRAPNYPDNAFGAYRDRVKPFLQETEHTPFTTLRTTIHINTSIALNEDSLPRFVLAMDRSYFTIDAHPIPFAKFKEYALDLVSKAEMELSKVLRGWDIDDIDTTIKAALQIGDHQNAFHDRLNDTGAGYSFFSDNRNHLKNERNRLLKYFLREGCDEFSTRVSGLTSCEVFKPVNCRLWLDEVDSLVGTLYAAAVTTWPGAGRGSELDHLTYRNDHGKRHLFMINNILTFVTTYIKTQQITGHAPLIPRGVDPRLARVFIITIHFVYYAASAIYNQLKEPEHSAAYTRYVFVLKGKPLSADRMTNILQEHTKSAFHKGFGIRDWRHIMKFVLRHLANIQLDPEDEEENDKDPINALFGHGSRIGNHVYAIESSSLSTNSAIDVSRAHRYGIEYQKALGLWPSLSQEMLDPIGDDENKHISKIGTDSSSTLLNINNLRQLTAMFERTLDTRLPAIGDQLTAMVARALFNNMPHPTPPHLPSSCAVTVHPSRLEAVAKLYKSESFQSPQQAAMFEFILQNSHTVFGVLPTGGGKSLMFYGPSIVEKDGITVVISPFVALSDEQYETAVDLGISVSRWPSNVTDMSTTRLLIVSAHAAQTNDFVSFIRASVEHGLIRRIIYDEAHQILLSAEYRDCYETLHLITQTGIPVHFLSATILQSSIDEIVRIGHIPPDTVYTIRAPTFRPNIRYDVQHFSNSRDSTAYNKMMERVEELCSDHAKGLDEDGRMLIYCSSYKECDEIRDRTGYPIHRAKGSSGDEDIDDTKKRRAVAHDWRAGKPKVLIATTGFGNGVDYPHVRAVISVNPRNGSDAIQQTGRAGRDGREANAYILGSTPLVISNIPDPDHAGVGIITTLYATADCIRICLGEFDLESYSCVSHGNSKALLCSRCQSLRYTKTISLIPAQPGPRNYTFKNAKSRASPAHHEATRSAHNNTGPISSIAATSSNRPQVAVHLPPLPRRTAAEARVIDHSSKTPGLTSITSDGQQCYPTPDEEQTVQSHVDRCPKGKGREVINMAPPPLLRLPRPAHSQLVIPVVDDVFTDTQSTPHDRTGPGSHVDRCPKGKGREVIMCPTNMAPPPLLQLPRPAHSQRVIPVVDDVFTDTQSTPHDRTGPGSPSVHQDNVQPFQRRQFSLPPIPPYRRPVSSLSSNAPATATPQLSALARHTPINQQTQPQLPSLQSTTHPDDITSQLPSQSTATLSTSLATARNIEHQVSSGNIRSITASRQQAADSRQAMSNVRKGYFAYIDQFFIIQETACVVCLLIGNPVTSCQSDMFKTCESGLFNPYRPLVKLDAGVLAANEFNTFRTKLRFAQNQHVCFFCMRQVDIDAHPHAATKETCAEYADIIKNFAWAVYCLPFACSAGRDEGERWRDVLFATFAPPPPSSRPQFEEWLSTTPDPQGLDITNLLMVCIRWTEMHVSHSWPPS